MKLSLAANWIWVENNRKPDDKVIFYREFSINELPQKADALIGVDTKYWLWINGIQVVCEGGLFRESRPGCGYADRVDLAKYLVIGKNTLNILCWYFGNEGRNNTDSGQAGLIFQCDALNLHSDKRFTCLRHPAYYSPGTPAPSYLHGGYSIGFDANSDIGDYWAPDFDRGGYKNAVVYLNNLWGDLYERPIPLHRISESCLEVPKRRGDYVYTVDLPYAMAFIPVIECKAKGGEILDVRTDRFAVNGGPGDENTYNSERLEYICKPGYNRYECINYLYGETINVQLSGAVDNLKIGYRETGYNCDIVGEFHSDCELIDKLFKKAGRTLYVCMRDNFMDCPDRERGQWIGDLSVQTPQALMLLSEEARLLLKKAICDFINLRHGDVLVGNVPGANASELPSQSLGAISEIGLIANYYKYTGDRALLSECLEPAVRYLMLWNMSENGLVEPRNGAPALWYWFDHLYNNDCAVLENAWYYSALSFAAKTADILGDHRFDDFIASRREKISIAFETAFWKGTFYASGDFVDDRANALAVLCGICPPESYPLIRNILLSVFNSTVYMENYVLSALCEMGYQEDAFRRMKTRYYNLAVNENSTLWEDFYLLGTKNHAWSGAPATIVLKYFMGVDTGDGFKSFTITPSPAIFKRANFRFQARGGTVHVKFDSETNTLIVDNQSDSLYIE
ncbi:MAG: hypothetical protein LBR98_09430 [Syntrophomonadaceae bacterium]|jgi:hypothetical protein|nr:hypothetical protein [Syntrophomonadaceae bacterium]